MPIVATAAVAEAGAALPLRRDAAEPDAPFAGTLIAILAAGLVIALAWAWRRQGRRAWDWKGALRMPPGGTPPRVVASTRLDARASLHVVEWEGSRLLLARGEHAITLIAQRPAKDGDHPATEGPAS